MAVNKKLIRQVVAEIEADGGDRPGWDQGTWVISPSETEGDLGKIGTTASACGTTMCFAGYAMWTVVGPRGFSQLYARELHNSEYGYWYWESSMIREQARKVLGLSYEQADVLFAAEPRYNGEHVRDLDTYKKLITEVTGVKFKSARAEASDGR